MVLTVAVLFRLYAAPSWRSGLVFAFFGSSVVLYHHVASFYLALLLALVAAVSLPYLFWKDRGTGVVSLISLACSAPSLPSTRGTPTISGRPSGTCSPEAQRAPPGPPSRGL